VKEQKSTGIKKARVEEKTRKGQDGVPGLSARFYLAQNLRKVYDILGKLTNEEVILVG
jgi:hypothetical protein